jgi:hypothetical protein
MMRFVGALGATPRRVELAVAAGPDPAVFFAVTEKVQVPVFMSASVVNAGTETVTGVRGTPEGSVVTTVYPLTGGRAVIGVHASDTVPSAFSTAVRFAGAGGGPEPRYELVEPGSPLPPALTASTWNCQYPDSCAGSVIVAEAFAPATVTFAAGTDCEDALPAGV